MVFSQRKSAVTTLNVRAELNAPSEASGTGFPVYTCPVAPWKSWKLTTGATTGAENSEVVAPPTVAVAVMLGPTTGRENTQVPNWFAVVAPW